jgi:hypothetical protein
VRGEPQRGAVDIGDVRLSGQVGEEFADPVGWDDLQAVVGDALEQVRQRRAEEPLVAVVTLQQRHFPVACLDPADDAGQDRDQFGVAGMTRSRSG